MNIFTLGQDPTSLRTQDDLGKATRDVAKNYAHLSSGLRINSAADDAAGLAVAQSLGGQSRVFTQGLRNYNDGVSLLNIADSTLTALTNLTTRLQELAEQSANGSNSSAGRSSLDAEAQSLAKEYSRIARSASFNNLNLFDGTLRSGVRLQGGFGNDGGIQGSVGGAIGTGTFNPSATFASGSASQATADLNGDGNIDIVTGGSSVSVQFGNGDGTFSSATTYGATATSTVVIADFDGDGIKDIAGLGSGIFLGNGNGTFRFGSSFTTTSYSGAPVSADVNGDGKPDLIVQGYTTTNYTQFFINRGDGSFSAGASYVTIGIGSPAYGFDAADVNGDGIVDVVSASTGGSVYLRFGNGDGTFKSATSWAANGAQNLAIKFVDINNDGKLDLISAGQSSATGTDGFAILLGNGDGTFGAPKTRSYSGGYAIDVAVGDFNGDGSVDFVTTDSSSDYVTTFLGNGDGTFGAAATSNTVGGNAHVSVADFDNDGVQDIFSSNGTGAILLNKSVSGISPILPFTLKTQSDSVQAIGLFSSTLSRLSIQHGVIGATESRLSTAIATLQTTNLQIQNASSRILDVDIASSSADLVKNQILQQAAASVLVHENRSRQLALTLIQN